MQANLQRVFVSPTERNKSRGRIRGVPRLDGARGKKQVWRPRIRTQSLSEASES